MGRPRAFDELAVLDASVKQFRARGIAHTSTDDLCAAAGVRRSSLYNTFDSKDELFVRSLERHVSITLQQQTAIVTDVARTGADRLATLLDAVLAEEDEARTEGHAAGCMVVSTRMTPDVAARDPRVGRILDHFHDEQLSLFAQVIKAGRSDGTLREGLSPTDAALLLVSAISGIRVLSQTGTPVAALRRVANLHLDTLKEGRR